MNKKRNVSKGDRFGSLTVQKPDGKDRHGHLKYLCQCDCGAIVSVISSFLFQTNLIRCRTCAQNAVGLARRLDIIGKVVRGWKVIETAGMNSRGVVLYKCECCNCGHRATKTGGAILSRKGMLCSQCPPDYDFHVNGNTAVGILPDGTRFLVNASMVPIVSKMRWWVDSHGYIVHTVRKKETIYLHRYVLGIHDSNSGTIDHINREKTDCRIENLRCVTVHQNCLNKTKLKNNTSGFIGVCQAKRERAYIVRIGLDNKDIYLGRTNDPVLGAQMYNIAAEFLFGEYAGQLNDVPVPDMHLRKRTVQKCLPYLHKAQEITFPSKTSMREACNE